MATIKHATYGTTTSALTTELNSLATATNTAASAAIDNSANLDILMDLELVVATQGVARTAGATIEIYLLPSMDGTNYVDTLDTTAELVAVFPLDAATTARRSVRRDIPIPPGLFKLMARNKTGQALAASANTLKYRTHNVSAA